jgi:hypothetical protein
MAADYTYPTPGDMTTAISNMETAYTDAAGRSGDVTLNLGAGNIQGETLDPGLYNWGTGVGFTSSLTFSGTSTDIWILQIAKGVTVGAGAIVTLEGGAKANNIFWQVAGDVVAGAGAHLEGVFLVATGIVFQTGRTGPRLVRQLSRWMPPLSSRHLVNPRHATSVPSKRFHRQTTFMLDAMLSV